ncbi:Uncharacterised protein [Klebsiella pneumoniae]|uniref:Uncharacterized protein n=1 Tax=Klebsiella pneumoniae TaxID=573 RepID=A0A2X3BVK4_KLEPN|nr:Uncharacterised protein [Klebsiella pneumoniae]
MDTPLTLAQAIHIAGFIQTPGLLAVDGASF